LSVASGRIGAGEEQFRGHVIDVEVFDMIRRLQPEFDVARPFWVGSTTFSVVHAAQNWRGFEVDGRRPLGMCVAPPAPGGVVEPNAAAVLTGEPGRPPRRRRSCLTWPAAGSPRCGGSCSGSCHEVFEKWGCAVERAFGTMGGLALLGWRQSARERA